MMRMVTQLVRLIGDPYNWWLSMCFPFKPTSERAPSTKRQTHAGVLLVANKWISLVDMKQPGQVNQESPSMFDQNNQKGTLWMVSLCRILSLTLVCSRVSPCFTLIQ